MKAVSGQTLTITGQAFESVCFSHSEVLHQKRCTNYRLVGQIKLLVGKNVDKRWTKQWQTNDLKM